MSYKRVKKQSFLLPKPYLSYSQMTMWEKNKEQYRQRYYLGMPGFENKETIFGKRFAKMMEDGISHPIADLVPRGNKMEYRIGRKILGVPFLGYLDSFDEKETHLYEYKTGKEPWTNIRVAKHEQLVVYSLLVKMQLGKVDPYVSLVWIQTQNSPVEEKVGGVTITRSTDIEFTGHVETFTRRIAQWERDLMAKKIKSIAEEISEDYKLFLENNEGNTKRDKGLSKRVR